MPHASDYKLTLNSKNQLEDNEAFEFHRRRLYSAASLHRAEHVATDLLYSTHYRVFEPTTDDFIRIYHSVNCKTYWDFAKMLFKLNRNGNLSHERYLMFLILGSRDLEALERFYTITAIKDCVPGINFFEMLGRYPVLMNAWHSATFDTVYNVACQVVPNQLCLYNATVHPLNEEQQQRITLDGYHATVFSSLYDFKVDFIKRFATKCGFPSVEGSRHYKNTEGTIVDHFHVIRFDEAETGKPLFYSFLSTYLERIAWFDFTTGDPVHDEEIFAHRRRVGGRIGAARVTAKTLELLTV